MVDYPPPPVVKYMTKLLHFLQVGGRGMLDAVKKETLPRERKVDR